MRTCISNERACPSILSTSFSFACSRKHSGSSRQGQARAHSWQPLGPHTSLPQPLQPDAARSTSGHKHTTTHASRQRVCLPAHPAAQPAPNTQTTPSAAMVRRAKYYVVYNTTVHNSVPAPAHHPPPRLTVSFWARSLLSLSNRFRAALSS